MAYKRRLNQFEKGFLVCLCSIVNGATGPDTAAREAYREIGCPTPEMARRSNMTEYDIEAIQKLHDLEFEQ